MLPTISRKSNSACTQRCIVYKIDTPPKRNNDTMYLKIKMAKFDLLIKELKSKIYKLENSTPKIFKVKAKKIHKK